jgi:hypothetical protein
MGRTKRICDVSRDKHLESDRWALTSGACSTEGKHQERDADELNRSQ